MITRGAFSDLPLWTAARAAELGSASVAAPRAVPAGDICANRHRGAPTSRLAQLDRAGRAHDQRARVHLAILDAGPAGLTVDELAARWGQPPNRLSGRFTELKATGLLQIAGHRRTRAGSMAIAWSAVGEKPNAPAQERRANKSP